MAKKKVDHTEDNFEIVEGALSKSEQFIEENSKTLTIVLGAIIAVVAIYMAYTRLYIAPMQEEAVTEMFYAENYFEVDSFNLALNGDGNNFGFLYIIDEYSGTKAANLANYYAGFCYLHLGDYDKAIDYLSAFSGKEEMLSSLAYGGIGDANAQLGNYKEAVSNYMTAASYKNDYSTPMYLFKAGILHEENANYDKALAVYEEIHKDYSTSTEGRTILKYIERVKLNM